jgi:hypothetical protein
MDAMIDNAMIDNANAGTGRYRCILGFQHPYYFEDRIPHPIGISRLEDEGCPDD